MRRTGIILGALAVLTGSAQAEAPPQLGRYLPLYPALYVQTQLSVDQRDSVFNADGKQQSTAMPSLSGSSSLPEQRLDTTLAWTFPLFEALPFSASRLYTARINLGYASDTTKGALADFARDTSDDDSTQADGLRTKSSGISDITLEFGGWLYGANNWRERSDTPFAVMLLGGLRMPVGQYDRDTAANPGSNTLAVHGQLGLYATPWSNAHLDAGLGYRRHFKNQDPAFGGLAPRYQGNDLSWDVSLAQRVMPGLYIAGFADGRHGKANAYSPRFAPNAPAAPANSDNFPTPGSYRDEGTELLRAGASLYGFVGQRWLLGLHYAKPLSGQSGEIDLPYSNRTPAGCTVGATGCNVTAGETVHVDGLGSARVFASDSFTLSLQYNFGQGDSYTCVGCKKP